MYAYVSNEHRLKYMYPSGTKATTKGCNAKPLRNFMSLLSCCSSGKLLDKYCSFDLGTDSGMKDYNEMLRRHPDLFSTLLPNMKGTHESHGT